MTVMYLSGFCLEPITSFKIWIDERWIRKLCARSMYTCDITMQSLRYKAEKFFDVEINT